jgi:reactive intermediate/imine deaminase
MTLTCINTTDAPQPIGCYSQAVKAGNLVFLAGQIGIDPTTHQLVSIGFEDQLLQVFKNLQAVLTASGATFAQVAKITIYLRDLTHFGQVNHMMSTYFKEPYPARVTVEVSNLPKNALIEIDGIVVLS